MSNTQDTIRDLEFAKRRIQRLDGFTEEAEVIEETISLLKKQQEIIDALLKVGYPHNFQREEPWIVNYMYAITAVVKKAVNLRNEEVKQDG
ncbi:MAG: hypothetical protein IKM73_08665 [Acidaminococcaceae bacterium]|nr:hypothetical protein [Acidaminococcaceae bacterium]